MACSEAATLDNETTVGEGPCPDGRSLGPTHRACQLRRLRIELIQIGESPPDRESQLRAGTQPRVRRQGAMDLDEGAGRNVVAIKKPSSEGRRSIRVLAFSRDHIGPRCRQPKRWSRSGGTYPAEPPPAGSTQIKDAKVKARVSLDTYDAALAIRLGANQEDLLTSLPSNTEACVTSFVFPLRNAFAVAAVVRRKLRRVSMREL